MLLLFQPSSNLSLHKEVARDGRLNNLVTENETAECVENVQRRNNEREVLDPCEFDRFK